MRGKIQHFIVADWCIILHGGLNQEFMLREHKLKGILLKAYGYRKKEYDMGIIYLEKQCL